MNAFYHNIIFFFNDNENIVIDAENATNQYFLYASVSGEWEGHGPSMKIKRSTPNRGSQLGSVERSDWKIGNAGFVSSLQTNWIFMDP